MVLIEKASDIVPGGAMPPLNGRSPSGNGPEVHIVKPL
jgi:hypothetical protein